MNIDTTERLARVMMELSVNDNDGEAQAILDQIILNDERDYRRRIETQLDCARRVSCRHQRRLCRLAMVMGVLSGMVACGWIITGLWWFAGVEPDVLSSSALSFVCGVIGVALAWLISKS